jgi:flagellar protein FlaG
MEINSTQVGQNFASKLTPEPSVTETASSDVQSSTLSQVSLAAGDIRENTGRQATESQIASAASQISDFVNSNSRQLNFSVDDASNKPVVKVTDANSGEVIRQIPSEEVLELSERLKDLQTDVGNAVGVLFNRQV